MAIGKFHLPIVSSTSGENLIPTPYERPSDWLPIDHLVSDGDQKFVGLVAIFEEGNFFSFYTLGTCVVDWGDGVVESVSGGNLYMYHQYDYNYSGFTGTECSRGYKQAIITITPQSGQNMSRLRFNEQHNQSGLNTGYSNGLLDAKLSGQYIDTLSFSTYNKLLEQFDFIGTNAITIGATQLFYLCYSLRKIKNLDTTTFTNFTSLFQSCRLLEEVPVLNTNNVTNFQDTFNGCYNLLQPPNWNLSVANTFTRMFQLCHRIIKFPDYDLSSGQTFTNMFTSCSSMVKNPILTFSSGLTKNFSALFSSCVSLKEYTPMINTNQASTYATMFNGCSSLNKVDFVDTSGTVNFSCDNMFATCVSLENAPTLDLSRCTLTTAMFNGCSNLKYVPDYNLPICTGFSNMFLNCYNLEYAPDFTINTTGGTIVFTSMFSGCNNLKKAPNFDTIRASTTANMFTSCNNLMEVPDYNLSNVTSLTNTMFGTCNSLIKGKTTGLRYGISYANCKLSAPALVDIFNGLGTAVGSQTITITGNWGASILTAPERAIATGKGWTIAG